ncbi:tail fiber assembly protein [Serratia ficaria]|uniref:tail fiber assembly protein n=1 Tax=Serratia ficaria TaxID=61651 RepID=UPI002179F381|nr:tail fiber assembly protein [Serratia ficaria]CAI0742731.1 Caudovirales tail fibre assembly protein [Serratia ficaria]CAI0788184.1 Caudovirales tail fibre assembly protein [Serratia ficaria]CAI1618369.1 Caudovirales tail fibre assembly protein [Serratia ficaria]CAI2407099.1 Caudovirales tail fibre assembly protein [Serratia ficaria]CAI2407879.1 Caudovirales tail fibre assembly protein [Serratia ficaria]
MSDFSFSDTDQALWLSHFDIKGVYIGSGLTVIPRNTGLPANTTTLKCEPEEGFTGVWNGNAWDYVRDNRGVRYWNKYGVGTVVVEIDDVIPEDAIYIAPPKKEPGCVYVFENGAWQQLQDRTGQNYYSPLGQVLYIDSPYFTLPEGCTFTAPPASREGYVTHWNNDAWEYVEDHRHQVAYRKEDGTSIIISDIGPLDAALTFLVPATPYDEWIDGAWVTNTEAEHAAQVDAANAKKTALRVEADSAIGVRSAAVKYGIATEQEKAELEAWERYNIELMRIDTSLAPGITWPVKP